MDEILDYIEANQDRFLELLYQFLRIPGISTDASKAGAMRKAAGWVRQRFVDCGLQAQIVQTPRHPAVLADTGPADGGAVTVLVYGHYDVQPVGDESLWDSPPFEPTVRNDAVYARGAADDKGQLLTHLLSTEAWMKTAGRLPVRVKFLIEGEEEIGSPSLAPLVESQRQRLACDYVVISDTSKFSADTPAITYGTKGIVYKEIVITGPKLDLHSGSFGGTVDNPGNALARVVAGLKDEDQRITIPGFYDDVQPISPQEQAAITALPFDENQYLKATGSPALCGEAGYTTLQRRWTRPTLDVNGLYGGFAGQGASTIIPARVGAKVSMRIVPDQDPHKISRAFDQAVRTLAPPGVRVEIREHATAPAYVCPIDSPGMKAATAALEAGFNKPPVLIREGGTLPILPLFRSVLGAESLMMGFCVPNCNAHGPNEFLVLDDFFCGIRTSAWLMHLLAAG